LVNGEALIILHNNARSQITQLTLEKTKTMPKNIFIAFITCRTLRNFTLQAINQLILMDFILI